MDTKAENCPGLVYSTSAPAMDEELTTTVIQRDVPRADSRCAAMASG